MRLPAVSSSLSSLGALNQFRATKRSGSGRLARSQEFSSIPLAIPAGVGGCPTTIDADTFYTVESAQQSLNQI